MQLWYFSSILELCLFVFFLTLTINFIAINISINTSRHIHHEKPINIACSVLFSLAACTSVPPKNSDNICATFREKEGWYDDAKDSFEKWDVPIHVQMAILHQESHFVADAQPPRPRLLGFIPWFRPSSAYGYAQAKDETWDDYLDKAGSWGALIAMNLPMQPTLSGWYGNISYSRLGISKGDANNLYLTYHEGHGGYQRKSFLKKPWLQQVAIKVAKRAILFQRQLGTCEKELESESWFFW